MSSIHQYRRTIEHLGTERRHDLSSLELERIEATIAMVPSDVRLALDVGCGDGRILERLPKHVSAFGIDYSYQATKHLSGRTLCASSEHLPFSDRSFDLVLCCEVLEHLPDEMFRRTLSELRRVSRKYVLISVPYKENLRLSHTRCHDCGSVFHTWGHVRRFTNRRLHGILDGFEVKSRRYVGKRDSYHLGFVLFIGQTYGGRWAEWDHTSMCPQCNNVVFRPTPRNFITIGCGLINWLTSRIVPVSRRNWVLTLYSRHEFERRTPRRWDHP